MTGLAACLASLIGPERQHGAAVTADRRLFSRFSRARDE